MKKKFKIALLVTPGYKNWLGGVNYIKNIIYSLGSLPTAERETFEVILICHTEKEKELYQEISDLVSAMFSMEKDVPQFSFFNKIKWYSQRKLKGFIEPRFCELLSQQGVDFVYPTLLSDKPNFPIKYATWLPDFQFIHIPEGTNEQNRTDSIANFNKAAKCTATIVLSSQAVEKDCLEFIPISKGKTVVFPFKVNLAESFLTADPLPVIQKYHLPQKFLFVANILAPTKNHVVMIDALNILREKNIYPTIVCSGSLHDYRNPLFVNEIFNKIYKQGVQQEFHLLGAIPRTDQIQLMRAATAMVQPSLFEGWNTGVEEAKMLGKKIIISDIAVHKEQDVPYAYYFDPTSPQQLAEQIARVWLDTPAMHGFDRQQEQQARNKYLVETQQAGRLFLNIAKQ
jgi:glycosyltransferase involved in cell wall biosynthesis